MKKQKWSKHLQWQKDFRGKVFFPRIKMNGFFFLFSMSKVKKTGILFAELVERIAQVDSEMRIRFTSPHPKDFPDQVLEVFKKYPNVCKSIHVPAQSGSTSVLERMRRGYTREAYVELVEKIKETLPGIALSSDFISGFCGETEEEHQETISLLEHVKYEQAYTFAYSLREKTHAHRHYQFDFLFVLYVFCLT